MSADIREISEKVQKESVFVAELKKELGAVIVGQEQMLDRLLVALFGKGHLLLEGEDPLLMGEDVEEDDVVAAAAQLREKGGEGGGLVEEVARDDDEAAAAERFKEAANHGGEVSRARGGGAPEEVEDGA